MSLNRHILHLENLQSLLNQFLLLRCFLSRLPSCLPRYLSRYLYQNSFLILPISSILGRLPNDMSLMSEIRLDSSLLVSMQYLTCWESPDLVLNVLSQNRQINDILSCILLFYLEKFNSLLQLLAVKYQHLYRIP